MKQNSMKDALKSVSTSYAAAHWSYVVDAKLSPAELTADLLSHAARVYPTRWMRITELARIVCGLTREPRLKSAWVTAVRREMRKVAKLLTARGRVLMRFNPVLRASVDQEDVRQTLGPRVVQRCVSGMWSVFVAGGWRLPPDLRAKHIVALREIDQLYLHFLAPKHRDRVRVMLGEEEAAEAC